MPIPTALDVQPVDPILTNMFLGYMQADSRFVAVRAFANVPVDKDSGTYIILTKKYWFLDEMKPRAYGDQFSRAGYGVSSSTYTTLQHALAHPIPDEVRANSQVPMELEEVATRWLAQQSLIRKERDFATTAFSSGVWTTNTTVSNKWSDYAASDPVSDLRTSGRTISQLTGLRPNTLIMGEIVDDRLQNHPDIIDRLKYTQSATAAAIQGAMAALLGLENYLVSSAVYNSANEGQSFSGSAIIDDDALLCYTNPGAGIFGATAGKIFYWGPGGGMGGVRSYYDDESDATILKSKEQWDQKVIAADLGDLMADCVD